MFDDVSSDFIETKISPIDNGVGGLKRGSLTLVLFDPEVEGEYLPIQIAYNVVIEKKAKVIFPYVEGTPDKIISIFLNITAKHIEVPEIFVKEYIKDNIVVIDGYSSLIARVPKETKFYVKNSTDPRSWIESFEQALQESRKDNKEIVFIASNLSSVVDFAGEEGGIAILKYLRELLNQNKIHSAVVGLGNWPYSEEFWKTINGEIKPDLVIRASRYVYKLKVYDYIVIQHCSWKDVSPIKRNKYLFRVEIPGPGFTIYIPKIIVTGPYNAGKSTFVSTLSSKSISVDVMGTTIALDFGIITVKGFSAHVFGTPGQERFDILLPHLAKEAFGVILIVDSTRPESLERAKEMLSKLELYGVPVVVAANKQDLPEALPPEEVKKRLGLPDDVPVIPTVALDRNSVIRVFETLAELVLSQGGGSA